MSDLGDSDGSHLQTDGDDGPDPWDRALVDSLADGLYRLDEDGRFVAVNDAIVETTGYARDDLRGEHVSLVVDAADVERLEREIRTRLEDGADDDAALDITLETADGERVPCEVRFSLVAADGAFEGTVGVVREVDDRNRRGDRSRGSGIGDSLTSVIDEADVGVFVLDDEFDVAWANEAVERYFGVNRSAILGRDKRALVEETLRECVADPDAFTESVLATYDNSDTEQFECRIEPGADRPGRWLEHRSRPIESGRYAGGRIELYYDVTDRKESEQSQRESERRFHSLVDAVEEYAIFMLDPAGRVVSWNEGAKRIKGYDAPEILGEHFSTFYTDDDRSNAVPERNLARARERGTTEDEGWRVRADGSRFWANVTITAIEADGEIQGYAKVTRDMTDRRERERELQRERDLIERILETSPVGIAVVESDRSISRANERLASLFGAPSDDDPSAGSRDLFGASAVDLSLDDLPVERVFETGAPLYDREVVVEPPGGQRRWLSINATPITDEQGQPAQVVVTATDVTELKALARRRKRELEVREKELAAVKLATNLLETDDQPVDDLLDEFVAELPQSFQQSERTAARVTVGDHEATTDAFEPLDRGITARTSTDNGTPIAIEVVSLESSPEADATPFLEEDQELIDTLATLVKFHFEQREYIDELQAETKRLEQFAYAASHDLQEPLRMVSSYLQLIDGRYGDELDEDGREFLEFAIDGAERMRSMIDGLLKYSRVQTRGDPFEPVDLDDVLEDVLADLEVKIVEREAEITSDPLPTVEGDASQLRQVFQNLLANAIEYSEGAPRVHVSAERTGREWTVSVRDEGIGIDPDETDRIFDVFQRLHSREDHAGTGIGLALCRRIVERHDGEIWVDSDPGEGSTFSVTLPPADESEE